MSKFMDKTMHFMTDKVSPKLNKATRNPYLSGLQAAVLKLVPLILVSSVVTIYNVVRKFVETLPDISAITTYTFGLSGLLMAFLLPYFILEKKGNDKKFVAGMVGTALYLMTVKPTSTEAGTVIDLSRLGAGGMFASIVLGFFIVFVFSLCRKIKVFGEDSAMPDFCREWFDTLLPVFLCVFTGWLVILHFDVDLFALLVSVFEPIVNISNSFGGMFLMLMIPTMFYTMGISGWLFSSTFDAIMATSTAQNVAAAAAGLALPCINVYGIDAHTFIGGRGNTLALNILFLTSKSKRLKNLGRAFIVPSVMNINEPIMFGNIVWNPILMLGTLLVTIVNLVLTYLSIAIGLVTAPHVLFNMWYLPTPIYAYFVTGIPGVILNLALIAIDHVIWYPFFKVYEKQVMLEDGELTQ